MSIPLLTLLLVGFGFCSALTPIRGTQSRNGELAPLHSLQHGEFIPDEYLVMFREKHTYEQHFKVVGKDLSESEGFTKFGFGYTMKLNDTSLCDDIRRDPGVLLVESNEEPYFIGSVHSEDVAYDVTSLEHSKWKRYPQNTATGAPYGLQMIAAKGKLPTPVKNFGNYDYVDRAGQGVNVYVFDSGIRVTHQSFGGRARHFGGLSSTDKSPYCRNTMDDIMGHGTHVAGIVGARTVGVAPYSNLINVKVVNNDATLPPKSFIAQAVIDVINEHEANKAIDPDYDNDPFRFRGSLINLSLGWKGESNALLYQLQKAEEAGIKVYAAAGNKNMDASNIYPCANVQAQCVAAVDENYNKAWFSNYGGAVDYLAPGDEIISLDITSDTALRKRWGTSMATAHATGAAAIFTFWQGLVNDQTKHYADYVWWNSLSSLATGFSGTSNRFINTGIHSPKKYKNEPFRWAGDWPVKNHEADDASIEATPAVAEQLTTFATEFVLSTVTPIAGLTLVSAFDTSSAIAALSTVTFSFDPSTSNAAATAT